VASEPVWNVPTEFHAQVRVSSLRPNRSHEVGRAFRAAVAVTVEVADRLAFSAPSMAFFRCRNSLRGFPLTANAVLIRKESTGTAVVTFASSSEFSHLAGSAEAVPPLMGFVQSVPLRRITVLRPLRDSVATDLRHSGAIQSTCSALVVSRHRDGLLRDTACGFIAPR
jgi:hypothetical protein